MSLSLAEYFSRLSMTAARERPSAGSSRKVTSPLRESPITCPSILWRSLPTSASITDAGTAAMAARKTCFHTKCSGRPSDTAYSPAAATTVLETARAARGCLRISARRASIGGANLSAPGDLVRFWLEGATAMRISRP